MILVIDNYDSFTFNLVQLLGRFTQALTVRRNDQIDCQGIAALAPERILISPGPGRPEDAGVTVDAIRRFAPRIPILGVCLGHQAIGQAFGARIVHAPSLMHGRTSRIRHSGRRLFKGLADPFVATRYHSLVIDPASLPETLERTAWTDDGVVMGVRHIRYRVQGVQFHPESILTEAGEQIIRNWLEDAA
ncbi:MAG TPA: aminodeoxychorismate/anthranilate synthase component II [Bacteroidota bacterium]